MRSDPIGELKWWELFNDPGLSALVTTALENNRDVRIAVSRIEQARANLGFTRADQYPRVDGEAIARTGNVNGGARSLQTQSTAFVGALFNWEIDFWGKFRRATDAARAELLASECGLKAVQLALISDVVTAYYQLQDFHQRLAIAQSTFESRQKSLEIIQQRFAKGITAQLDVDQAEIQKEIAAASIPRFKRSIRKTENVLSVLLGGLPSAFPIMAATEADSTVPDIPVGLPADIIERRPDISEAWYILQAQTEAIGVAIAQRLPAISLTGPLGVASTDLGSLTTDGAALSIAGQVLAPLIDFGKNKRRVEVQRALAEQALHEYHNVVLVAFREVEDALAEIVTYKEELEVIARQKNASQSASTLSRARYDKGVSSFLEVLDTERTLFEVELDLSELQQLYRVAHVNLYKALGGGWIDGDCCPAPEDCCR
jgi:multidrug efflux system outer membrane protein